MTAVLSKPRAVAYYRASAELPHVHPISYQQYRVLTWARLHHVEIVREFIDLEPVLKDAPPLPAFAEMLQWITQQEDCRFILCSDLTRVRRLPEQAAEIARCGKRVISVAATHFVPDSFSSTLDP